MYEGSSYMSDEEIVSMALHDKAFFAHIVFRYEERLSRYVQRLGIQNLEDRQDVLQDIFIKVYKYLNSFDTSLSFSSWIYRIAHNEAISAYRKKKVRPEGHLVDEGEKHLLLQMAVEDDAETQFDTTLNASAIEIALDRLSEKYKSVLMLRYFEHKEYNEISDILKIPIGSVGTLIHRGKKQLRKYISEEQDISV